LELLEEVQVLDASPRDLEKIICPGDARGERERHALRQRIERSCGLLRVLDPGETLWQRD